MKVLVAENNAELLKLLSHLIEREGFKTFTAGGGGAALQIYRAEKPDIVCLDILMDDMSGYDVCREIRKNDAVTPIVFITSKSGGDSERLGREAGGDEYMVKPFDLAEIKRMMRQFARQCLVKAKPEALDDSYDLGPLKIFPNRLLARRGEDEIDLSLLDISLCDYFYHRRGEVLSASRLHGELFRALPSVADAKTVEVHMKQLLKKIERDAANPEIICPVEGGYAFG